MRRTVLALMLALGLFALLTPVLEAGPCDVPCAGDDAGAGCAQDFCCSCCVHFRVDAPQGVNRAVEFAPDGWIAEHAADRRSTPDPRDILHVPKPLV